MQPLLQHYLQQSLTDNVSPLWHQYREKARRRFLNEGLPSFQNENWRYLARSMVLRQPFTIQPIIEPTPEVLTHFALPDDPDAPVIRVLFVNGYCHIERPSMLPKGLSIEETRRVISTDPNCLMDENFETAHQLGHGFNALNTLFSQDGVRINVADECTIVPTIELWYLSHPTLDALPMFCVRNHITVGHNSRVNIVEHVATSKVQKASPLHFCLNTVTTLNIQSSAQVRWAQSTYVKNDCVYIGQLAARQACDSQLHTETLASGGGVVRHTLSVDLCETGARCHLQGLNGANQRQQVDHQATVVHHADHTESNLRYYGIADDQGSVAFSGEVTAKPEISNMTSHQSNRNLLLSDTASIYTKPRLALFAGDIQCTHGATVGALDAHALFYLEARGVPKAVARLMLIQAFGQSLWESMPLLGAFNAGLLSRFLRHMALSSASP